MVLPRTPRLGIALARAVPVWRVPEQPADQEVIPGRLNETPTRYVYKTGESLHVVGAADS